MKFPPPVAELIGVEVEEIGAGGSVMTMVAEERHSNPMGTIHGGILCDLADAAMGVAFFSTLEPGESFTTLELKINFLRPFWTGKLVARGKVVQRGKTVKVFSAGVAELGAKRRPSLNDHVRLASMSKAYSGAAAL